MKTKVVVTLKTGVLDPQGQTIQRALQKMGYQQVLQVKQGKYFELEFESNHNREEALELTQEIAYRMLSNPIIESFHIEEVT